MRLDLLTSDWHKLLKPVLPHASTDKDNPPLQAVRLELGPLALYAVATDRYTLGAERYPLAPADRYGDWPPVHIDRAEAAATLKMLPYAKDYDPPLRVTVDRAPFTTAGHAVDSWAVTIDRPDDGTRLMLRDRRDPSEVNTLTKWRAPLARALTRPRGHVLDALDVPAWELARWKDACRGAEQLRLWTGSEKGDALLVAVERHFLGVATVQLQLPDPSRERSALPWAAELLPDGSLRTFDIDTESGEITPADDDADPDGDQ